MRWGSKTLLAAVTALLLAVGVSACGGGGSTSSSASTSTSTSTGAGARAKGESGGEQGTTSFKPKPHHDSGGGSGQYIVKGGDNSIQSFGSEVEGSEFEAASAALHGFLDARAAGDWSATCSYMSKSVVESFEQLASRSKQPEGADCAEVLAQLTNPAAKREMEEEANQADVGSLRAEGERAFLIYTGAKNTVIAMPMADEGGRWKVASLAGTPLS